MNGLQEIIGHYTGYAAGLHMGKDGTDVPIYVTDRGQWLAQIGERVISDWTRAALTTQIDKLTKRKVVKVSVPVTRVSEKLTGIMVRHGVLTGIHGSNDNPLVTWTVRDSEVKEQITDGMLSGGDGRYFEKLSAERLDELARLLKAKRDADSAYKEFRDAHGMNVRETILNALDNAKE